MDIDHVHLKSIELLQNKKQGIGFNRVPKDCRLKKQIEAQQLEIDKYKEETIQLKKKLEKVIEEKKQNDNLLQKKNRELLLSKSDITSIITRNDDDIINIFNDYLIMKQYIINSK
tara:strand:- start:2590 stop:2934 length:345 start_codon:yes stop_codon:yes gene_type:complete